MDLLDHPLLRTCQVKRKRCVALLECVSDKRHRDAVHISAADIFLLQERQLQEEKLLEFQSVFCLLEGGHVLREVYVSQCIMQWHESVLGHKPLWEAFLFLCKPLLQGHLHHAVHHLAGDAGVLELLCAWVDTGKRACDRCGWLLPAGRSIVHFWVHDVDLSVECGRLAEKYEFPATHEFLMHPLDALEEHHLHLSAAVAYPCAHPLAVMGFNAHDLGLYLHISHVRTCIRNPDKAASVYVPEGEDPEQFSDCAHIQLLPEKFRPLGAHSRKVLHLHI